MSRADPVCCLLIHTAKGLGLPVNPRLPHLLSTFLNLRIIQIVLGAEPPQPVCPQGALSRPGHGWLRGTGSLSPVQRSRDPTPLTNYNSALWEAHQNNYLRALKNKQSRPTVEWTQTWRGDPIHLRVLSWDAENFSRHSIVLVRDQGKGAENPRAFP